MEDCHEKNNIIVLICLLTLNLFGCSKKIDPVAQKIIDEIAQLETSDNVTLAEIEKIKERYNSLTDDQKKQVSNYVLLLEIEDNCGISLTMDNYENYINVTGGYEFSGTKSVARASSNVPIYSSLTAEMVATGNAEYQYNGVEVTIEFHLDYFPYTTPKNNPSGDYGFRGNTTSVIEQKTYTIKCDISGNGNITDTIECQNGMFGEESICKRTYYKVTDISGTVIPIG